MGNWCLAVRNAILRSAPGTRTPESARNSLAAQCITIVTTAVRCAPTQEHTMTCWIC